jgi:hypothetical protein
MKPLLRVALIGLTLAGVYAPAPRLSAHDYFQAVTGRASVDLRGQTGADVQYHITINAYQDLESDFLGTVVTRLSRADHGSAIVFSKVGCMVVAGNAAWIGSTVTNSTNDALLTPGDQLITYVRDFGDTGDIVHHEAVKHLLPNTFDIDNDGDVDCHDRPALYPSTIDSGNVTVR